MWEIFKKQKDPRSYLVDANGVEYRRNRWKFIYAPHINKDTQPEIQIPFPNKFVTGQSKKSQGNSNKKFVPSRKRNKPKRFNDYRM